MADKQSEKLLSRPKQEYGDNYSAHLFDQYKMLVDSAHQVSDRRSTANNYLLTVNSALITFFGIMSMLTGPRTLYLVIPVAGILVSITWAILITSYRRLNSAKFQVIHEFEHLLPAAIYRYEWHLATQKRYKTLSHIEVWIPIVFIAVHLALAIHGIHTFLALPK